MKPVVKSLTFAILPGHFPQTGTKIVYTTQSRGCCCWRTGLSISPASLEDPSVSPRALTSPWHLTRGDSAHCSIPGPRGCREMLPQHHLEERDHSHLHPVIFQEGCPVEAGVRVTNPAWGQRSWENLLRECHGQVSALSSHPRSLNLSKLG